MLATEPGQPPRTEIAVNSCTGRAESATTRATSDAIGKRSACALANTTRLPLPRKERPKIRSGVQRHAELRLLQKPLLRHRVAYGASRRGEASLTYLTAHHRARHQRGCGETALPWFTGKLCILGYLSPALTRLLRPRWRRAARATRAQQGRLYRAHTRRPLICWEPLRVWIKGCHIVSCFRAGARYPCIPGR